MKIEQIISKSTLDESVRQQAIIYKGDVYTYFDTGLTRWVFANKDKTKVIKLLINKTGMDFNKKEIDIYENTNDEFKIEMAKTEISADGMIIEQEFANPIKLDSRPLNMKQMLFAASCRNEVGWNADGNLVCFDLDEYRKY